MMEIRLTDNYCGIEIKDEQLSQVSSEENIIEGLKSENVFGFYASDNNIKIGFALFRQFEPKSFFYGILSLIIDFKVMVMAQYFCNV